MLDNLMNFQYFKFDGKKNEFTKNEKNEKKLKLFDKRYTQQGSHFPLYYSCDENEKIYFPLMFFGKECFFICVDAPTASVVWKIKVQIPHDSIFSRIESKLISTIWTVLFYSKEFNKIIIIDTNSPKILVEKEVFAPKETFSKSKKLGKDKLVGFGSDNIQNNTNETGDDQKKNCNLF
jgi:hypothetical protein